MAKTNPIGIRFEEEKLNLVKEQENLTSPQKVVNFLLDQYWWSKKFEVVKMEIEPHEKKNVPKKKQASKIKSDDKRDMDTPDQSKDGDNGLPEKEEGNAEQHRLRKQGDPAEGSMGFYLKYECYSYNELEKIKNQT